MENMEGYKSLGIYLITSKVNKVSSAVDADALANQPKW